jgi:large subunit ribosomal protein L31e
MAKKEPKVKLERSYNVPLRKSFRETAKHKKTPRAVRVLREFLKKHMKAEEVKLGMHLNEHMWKHGIKNPPHHVKVHAIKEDDVVKAELEGFEYKEAVKSEKKKEPTTMKDKLVEKLGGKEEKEEPAKEEKEEKKAEEKKTEEKPVVEEPKKEKTPTTHELAAKKAASEEKKK